MKAGIFKLSKPPQKPSKYPASICSQRVEQNVFSSDLVFIFSMVISLMIPPKHDIPMWLPLAFLGVLFITHSILGVFSRKDSQISQLIFSVIQRIKNRIPGRLVV